MHETGISFFLIRQVPITCVIIASHSGQAWTAEPGRDTLCPAANATPRITLQGKHSPLSSTA